MSVVSKKAMQGFTLVELLVVISIIVLISAMAGPAIQALSGAGTINKSVNDLSRTLQLARTYAIANHAHVLVAFSPLTAGTAGRSTSFVIVLTMTPANGGLDSTNDSSSHMGDSSWIVLDRPLILENLVVNDQLNTSPTPDTSSDDKPSGASAIHNGRCI